MNALRATTHSLLILWLLTACSLADGISVFNLLAPRHNPRPLISALQEHDKPIDLAILWHTFGRNLGNLRAVLDTGKVALVQVHLINAACQRNRNCGRYEFLHGLSVSQEKRQLARNPGKYRRKLARFTVTLRQFMAEYPNVRWIIAPELESNMQGSAAKQVLRLTKRVFRGVPVRIQYAWTSIPYTRIRGAIAEVHNATGFTFKRPCIANLDGTDISWPNRPSTQYDYIQHTAVGAWLRLHRQCRRFLWTTESNGRYGLRRFVDPRKRNPNQYTTRLYQRLLSLLNAPIDLNYGNGLLARPADNGGFVVVLPPIYRANRLSLKCAKGSFTLRNTGLANPWKGNLREHWRTNTPVRQLVSKYGANCTLILNRKPTVKINLLNRNE